MKGPIRWSSSSHLYHDLAPLPRNRCAGRRRDLLTVLRIEEKLGAETLRALSGFLPPGGIVLAMPMRSPRAPRTVSLLLMTIALIATACGSSSDTPAQGADSTSSAESADATGSGESATEALVDPTSEPDVTESSSTDSDENSDSQPDSLEGYLGTAAAFLRRSGGGGGFGSLDTDEIQAEQQLIEIETQKCMQAQGFEYVPEQVTDGPALFNAAGDQGLSAEDYAATEGFGISTRFDELFSGDVVIEEAAESGNDQLLAAMSEGEAEAWQIALQGEPPERDEQGRIIDPETGEVQQGRGRVRGGCEGEAETTVRGDLTQLGDLSAAWEQLQDRVESDPRITEINRDWASCMLDGGFDYADADEARSDFESQFRPLMRSWAQAARGDDAEAGPGQGGRGGAGGFLSAIAARGLTDEQEAELRALQDLEIAAAVASQQCSGDTAAEVDEIEARYEAEFLEENRALLESFGS